MATLTVNIIVPHANDIVGKNTSISVTGNAAFQGAQGDTFKSLDRVDVRFGENGSLLRATVNRGAWQCTGTVPSGAIAGTPLQISASAQATYHPKGNPPNEFEPIDGTGTVVVMLEKAPPELTIEPFATEVIPPTLPYRLSLRGTARDVGSGVASVKFRIDDGEFANVDNLSGDWARWAKTIDLPEGEYDLTIQATDTLGNSASQSFDISIRTPFEPTDVDQVFAATTYLRELLDFAKRQIKIGATGTGPTAQVLANRFFQPFDKLTVAKAYEQAVLPVHQARIAIEVLRQRIHPAEPPEIDRRFRSAVYQALVRELGTSHEELRLARVADAATRRALATRIGIEIESPRPDHLDQMTFLPDDVTDIQLEELFGYRSTAPTDPLQPPGAGPTFLLWRLGALRNAWQRDDAETRDSADGALPIIDPDLIDKSNLKIQLASNPAFALWTARKNWIDATLTNIQHEAGTQTNPLTRFDQIGVKFVGNIDLPALAARDANGENVAGELKAFNLDLEAFRFLARCRELLVAGTLLQSEWQDIFAILLQRQKQLQYRQWRAEERQAGLILEPSQFLPDADGPAREIPRWRGASQTFSQWRRTLLARAAQKQTVETSYRSAVDAAEAQTLSGLRDALIEVIGQRQTHPEDLDAAAERLTRELLIDFRTNAGTKTTRVDQALETLQGILFSVRSGRLATGTDGAWTLQQQNFDAEWVWMGNYRTWLAAIRVFAYPENQLFPNLYLPDGPDPILILTKAFLNLDPQAPCFIRDLRQAFKVTPESARKIAADYLRNLQGELVTSLPAELKPPTFSLTDQMSDIDLVKRQQLVTSLFGNVTDPNSIPQYLREVFWLVPMALALRLHEERQYLAALDWFQTVYAFNLPPANRKIYRGLTLEESITSAYVRVPEWLTKQLNPHIIARTSKQGLALVGRKNVYTRFTVMSIVRCFLAYADLEFSRNLAESIARARTLYETAADLLALPDLSPETGPTIPFPANPVWNSLGLHAQSNLAKIHNGLNIAGVPTTSAPQGAVFLPSQYRYAVLIERAKNLVGIAQQVESAYLGALERKDAETYSLFQANHDIQVAGASITLSDLKVADADIVVTEAGLQKDKADIEFKHFDDLINGGLNDWEEGALAAMTVSVAERTVALFNPVDDLLGREAASAADLASATAQFAETKASFERREEDWRLRQQLSDKDRQIGEQQILHAQNQKQVALQERKLAGLQLEHAVAVLDFLANKFTNAELFEWMSGVLGQVYAYFLQQSTAIAQLAQAQLAFERQETAPGFIRSDYWQDTSDSADSGSGSAVDRQGLTGSARLLQDIFRLDQYAFETDRRKLHLTQTLSLSQIASLELQRLRETGVLVFATPMGMFDQEFPGHYLRLIKRVRVSVIALVPPVRGVRATLSASGLSSVIVAGDEFSPVTLSRSPEAIAFTSPLNATGLFELEPENGLLLPFEGMGVDAVWQLELPKAANPFDYRTIADVLLTIEYTALNSYEYRQQVLRARSRSFGGDRAFSVREQFPDAWYELNNPESVADEASRMRAMLPTRREDYPPHLEELAVQELSLFCLRKDGFTEEVSVSSLTYNAASGEAITAAEVRTTGGIVGTRRPNGAAWRVMVGQEPIGEWSIQLENTELVRAWFKNGSIQDLVLVVTVAGVTPAWP